jgi:hypothetical protein
MLTFIYTLGTVLAVVAAFVTIVASVNLGWLALAVFGLGAIVESARLRR